MSTYTMFVLCKWIVVACLAVMATGMAQIFTNTYQKSLDCNALQLLYHTSPYIALVSNLQFNLMSCMIVYILFLLRECWSCAQSSMISKGWRSSSIQCLACWESCCLVYLRWEWISRTTWSLGRLLHWPIRWGKANCGLMSVVWLSQWCGNWSGVGSFEDSVNLGVGLYSIPGKWNYCCLSFYSNYGLLIW